MSPSVDLEVTLEGGDWSGLGDEPDHFASQTISAALAHLRQSIREPSGQTWPGPFALALTLVDDGAMRAINRDHRGQDKPTNVLSFPAWEGADLDALAAGRLPPGLPPSHPAPLGDILMAAETVAREAADQGKSFADHACHLLVHGFLHLLGYDHIQDDEAEIMEALETQILESLGISDPYQDREHIADRHE